MERKTVAWSLVVVFLAYLTLPNFDVQVQLDTFSLILLGVILILYFSDELVGFIQSIKSFKYKGIIEIEREIHNLSQSIDNDGVTLEEISEKLKILHNKLIELDKHIYYTNADLKSHEIQYVKGMIDKIDRKINNRE